MTENRRRKTAGLILLSLLAALILASSTAAAASFTVEHPAGLLTPGETITLPVTISDASDIAGFQLYIKHDSNASVRIKADSAAVEGLYLNTATNKAVLYPDLENPAPLYGTKKLFDLELTPAAGENIQITFDVVEVIDSQNNDITASCVGVPALIHVTDGKTIPKKEDEKTDEDNIEWVYESTENPSNQTFGDQSASYYEPDYSTPQQPSSAQPVYTAHPGPVKSPGFLPITLLSTLGAGIAVLAFRQNRKGGT